MKLAWVIVAAGMGARLGAGIPKALVTLAGKALAAHTIGRLVGVAEEATWVVVIPEGFEDAFDRVLREHVPGIPVRFVVGGEARQDSVGNGLAAVSNGTEIVAIHDAARPFVPAGSVRAALEAAEAHGAATVAMPAIDTILEAEADAFLASTPDRSRLWACQTPQVFRKDIIDGAHRRAREQGLKVTDDATLVRNCGWPVKLVEGSRMNIKITTPEDLLVAELALGRGLL